MYVLFWILSFELGKVIRSHLKVGVLFCVPQTVSLSQKMCGF